MTAFDRNVFVKMLLSVPQKDDAALFPKSERSPYIQKLLETFDKEETIDLSIIDWDAFQIENVTPENYERVYHRLRWLDTGLYPLLSESSCFPAARAFFLLRCRLCMELSMKTISCCFCV